MPSKPSKVGGDGPLLKTWRQEGTTGARAKVWLSVRRLTAIAVALLLAGWLAYLMFSPMFLPKTHFVYLCTDELPPLVLPPVEYTAEDFAGFTKLENALTPAGSQAKPLSYSRLMSPALLQAELDALKSSPANGNHPLILFVAAHGIVREGKAYLACGNFNPVEGNDDFDGLYAASKLVKQLAEIPGGIKLLLLDATRNEYAPRLGMIENDFASVLQDELASLDLPSVWVLQASSPREKSRVSRALHRSIFGYMCAVGLQGAADANEDNEVHLDEFVNFVRHNVAEWVKKSTGNTASQTPMLLSPGNASGPGEELHLLYTANLPAVEPVSSAVSSAQDDGSRTSIVAAVQDYLSGEVDEFGVKPIFSAIGTAKEKLGLDSDEEDGSEEQAEEPNDTDLASRRESQNEVELGLFEDAWSLTHSLAKGQQHPAEYAPHLWRLHLDQLVWLEYQQQAGERMNQLPLIDELRGLIGSLRNFNEVAPSAAKNPNVIDRLRQAIPTVPIDISDAPTLAIAEAVAAVDRARPLPDKLIEFVREYDSWLRSSEGMDRLDAIKGANWDNAWSKYYEFQNLDTYRDDPDVPQEVAKLVFQIRRQGEKVTADLLWGQGWAAGIVGEADRLRLEGERLLADHADASWLDTATDNLRRARTLYGDAQAKLTAVRRAKQMQSESLIRVRDYLRWCRYCWGDATSRAPSAQRIESMLVSLKDLRDALASPHPTRAPNLGDLRRNCDEIERQLSQGVEELASSPYEPGDAERITAILKTALLTADQRARCIDARAKADEVVVRSFEDFETPSAIPSKASKSPNNSLANDQLKVEQLLLDTLFLSGDTTANSANTENSESSEVFTGKQLGNQLFKVGGIVASAAKDYSNLTDPNRRQRRLEQLQHAAEKLYLIDALDTNVGNSTGFSVVQQVINAKWYDLLSTARQRFIEAQADAPPDEVAGLRLLANRCGTAASKIANQPEILNLGAPRLALRVQSGTAELISTDEATIDFTVQSFGQDGPVWVVAQYDADAIDVAGVNWTILNEREIKDAPIDSNSQIHPGYPYRPGARQGLSETMRLGAGQSRDLSVKVRRLGNARGNTTLVLKAISGMDFVRQEVPVRLPGRQDLEISFAGSNHVLRNLGSMIELFANRTQELTIYLANSGTKDRTIVASIYAPQRAARISIPTGSLEPVAAEQILQRIGSRVPIAIGSTPMKLAPNAASQALLFDFQTPENKLSLGASPNDGPVKISVPHGLLLDIVDQETREHTIRWLQFEVWRPHAFLNARANYDPGSRRVRITAEAIDPQECPEGEVELTLEVDRRFVSARGGGTYSTFLRAPNFRGELETTLTGRWPRDFDPLAADFLPIRVNVDGYPRGFVFRLPKTTTATNLRPTRDKASLEFVAPERDSAFAASDSVEAHVEVEAPEGYFNIPDSFVEIGIDKNQDRELRDEESVVLRSDREVDVFVKVPLDGGTLAFEPRVSDFKLNLRTTGISDRKVNVLGQLTAAGRIAERSYVPIVLDGEGPQLGVVKLVRDGPALVVEINPEDLTGIKSVEAAFESSSEVKWVPGKRGAGGAWFVQLDTKDLSPGEYTVLLRATDDVGNLCDVISTPWTNDPEEVRNEAPQGGLESKNGPPEVVKNQVKGRVTYGRQTVTDIEVTLTGAGAPAQPARTGAGGTFDFGMVPAGTYTLDARGLAGGNYHKAQTKITVSDLPKTPLELEVKIR